MQKSSKIKTFGQSMRPLFFDGDIVYLKRIKFPQLKVNDIVCVKKNDDNFTHRVIYKSRSYLITKGDNNKKSDGKIYSRQIIGRVYQAKRNNQIFRPEELYLMQSTLYFLEIVKIKKILEKEGIDFVFLKGLPLHFYFEKNHPQRIYLDCDILVAKKNFEKTVCVLRSFGYKKIDTSLSKTQKKLKDKEIEASFYKVISGFPVVFDVHLEAAFLMTQLGRLEALYQQKLVNQLTDVFLKEKKYIRVKNEKFPILSADNLIIYLALHFFHHNFKGAFRLEFLNRVINHHLSKNRGNTESRISQKIVHYRLQNFIYPTLILLNRYYHSPAVKKLLTLLKKKVTRFNKKNVLKVNIFDEETRLTAGITRFTNLFLLSPNSFLRKMTIFLNPQVLYLLFWVIAAKLRSKSRLFR